MSYNDNPSWTTRIEIPDENKMVCPGCGKVAFNVEEVMACLRESSFYEPRHIPDMLIFTCDTEGCVLCDEDFVYYLSAKVEAVSGTKINFRIEEDGDGFWAFYEVGWKSSTDPIGSLHQDHADTRSEIIELARSIIPCNCKECLSDKKEQEQ